MNASKFDIDKIDHRLSSLYSTHLDKKAKYNQWADSYDSDLVNDLDYVAHLTSSKAFSAIVTDKKSRVLDVACGTGLVGIELQKLGYQHIDGTDFSSEMIRVSRDKDVYGNLFQHDFTTPLNQPFQYDALICVGLFAFSVPPITNMIYVINAVKPGGICIITVNSAAWRELNLESAVNAQAQEHNFTIQSITQADYIRGEGIDCRILVIRSDQQPE
ncbi:MAG: methyltransferase domain-containing protein [Gammaproteobacteria bacterium]|nr:methyltransferase domain-containing protein [Gammaproteobacteria bacterium]